MTAKEYLRQYKEATLVIDRLRAEYEEEMEKIDSIRSALGGDGLPHSGQISKKVEDDAIRLMEKAEELVDVEVAAVELRQSIVRTINKVKGPSANILRERYINLRLWEDVADCVGYSLRRTFELHREGLDAVDQILKK